MATSSRKGLRSALAQFSDDLRGLTQQLQEGVNSLQKATHYKPCIGRKQGAVVAVCRGRPTLVQPSAFHPLCAAREFKGVLEDMHENVADLEEAFERLERFTVDAVSFEVWRCPQAPVFDT
jgi:hypothetical protein